MTILLVDDSDFMREIWRRMFESSFDDIREASNLLEAIQEMRREPHPDLVFLDVIIPNSPMMQSSATREQHLDHIRQLKKINDNVIIFVLSGVVSLDEYAPLAQAAGASLVTSKKDLDTQVRLVDAIKPHLLKRLNLQDTLRLMEITANIA